MAVHNLTLKSKDYMGGEIIIDNISLFDMKIYAATRPKISVPLRSIDIHSFKGRHGFVIQDHNSFGEREIEIKLSVLSISEKERETKRTFLNQLIYKPHQFGFYSDPYGVYNGIVTSIEYTDAKQYGYSLEATMKITAQPFRVLETKRISLNKSDIIRFDLGEIFPMFYIQGSGDYTITIGRKTYNFRGVPSGTLVFDCKHRRVYQDGTNANLSHCKTTRGYPVIKSNQTINWTGNIASVSVVLEWGAI